MLFDGTVLEFVERYAITDLPLIAGMVFDVVALKEIPHVIRRSVEKVSVGGAATPMVAKQELAASSMAPRSSRLTDKSESTNGVAMARGTSVFDREGTVGRMNPYVHVAVRRADGSAAVSGEEGEIVIGGPRGRGCAVIPRSDCHGRAVRRGMAAHARPRTPRATSSSPGG